MVFAVRHVLHEGLLRSSMPWRRPSYESARFSLAWWPVSVVLERARFSLAWWPVSVVLERVRFSLAWWPVSVVPEGAVASINSRYQNVRGGVKHAYSICSNA